VRTVIAGLAILRRAPFAIVPMALEAVAVAVLMIAGALPATGASAAAAAVFPLDLFFDVKQSLAQASGWISFGIVITLAVLARGAVLVVTLWLAEGRSGPLLPALLRGFRLSAIAAIALLPSAILLFAGTAVRYAPFIWAGAFLGLLPAFALARSALRIDVGTGPLTGKGIRKGSGTWPTHT
jgi:hypothetical protein